MEFKMSCAFEAVEQTRFIEDLRPEFAVFCWHLTQLAAKVGRFEILVG